MSAPVTAVQIYPALQALLGLPDMCTKFELRVSCSDIVTVACEYYPNLDTNGIAQLTAVFGEYELVRRGKVAPHPAEAMGFDAWMRQRTERAHAEFMARTSAKKFHAGGMLPNVRRLVGEH
jgi:hypothetical protein